MTMLGSILKNGISFSGKLKQIKVLKPVSLQRKTLIKLLTKAQKTEFGKTYKFKKILLKLVTKKKNSVYEEFKATVPIHDYNKMYSEWWYRCRAGESDVTWPGSVKHFALSSGTSEAASKAIPVTKAMIKAIHKTSISQILALGQFKALPKATFEKGYLLLGGCTELIQIDGHFEGDLSGITIGKMPFWFERFFKPGRAISQLKNWEEKLDKIVDEAPYWDISVVAGVPAWIQLLFERIIQKHKLKDIHDIWPNLVAYGWGGVAMGPYKEGFKKLLNPNKTFYYLETYLASEGFIALQTKPFGNLKMILNNGIFYEFIPFNDENFDQDGNLRDSPKTLMVHEVKENVDYALLLSTCAGAWRYLIGDTIRFKNLKTSEIIITGRTKHFMSLCGEHLSVDNMNLALLQVSKEMGIPVKEFTLIGKEQFPFFSHEWYIGCDCKVDTDMLLKNLDSRLKTLNDDYAVEREHALKFVNLTVLPTQVFLDWMSVRGKIGGQHKFPRVLKGATAAEWENFIQKNQKPALLLAQ
jgi:GH3 auxin-responsive promoter